MIYGLMQSISTTCSRCEIHWVQAVDQIYQYHHPEWTLVFQVPYGHYHYQLTVDHAFYLGFSRNNQEKLVWTSRKEHLDLVFFHKSHVVSWWSKNHTSRENLVLQLWLLMLSANQVVVFFDYQYLWKESINTLGFLAYRWKIGSSREDRIWGCGYYWWDVASFASRSIRLYDSLIINTSGKNQAISYYFRIQLVIKWK